MLDMAILAATAVVAVFVFSIVGRLSYSRAERAERPPRVLRTQVLNGCGTPGVAAQFGDQLMQAQVAEFRFDIIDRNNFDRFDVERTFITAYTLSPDDALRLAEGLGLGPDDMFMAEAADNPLGLDVTIVLGKLNTVRLPTAESPSGARSKSP